MPEPSPEVVTKFIERWEKSGAAEKANYALFLTELCDLLDLPHPDPAGPNTAANLYTFERAVTRKKPDGTTSTGFIDLYRAGSFVLETKQGTFAKAGGEGQKLLLDVPTTAAKVGHGKRGTASFDKALQRAYYQARGYVSALPVEDGRPPFLIVCDVGHSIDLYAEFTGTGGDYERFPDPISHRINLPDLHKPKIRERLRTIWTDPHSLDPSKHAAAVTREVAKALADLAKSLEKDGHDPQVTAGFLQRCLFTMFAEDIGLLPADSFLNILRKVKDTPAGFPVMLRQLWQEMASGTAFSTVLLKAIPHFNGGLFDDTTALPLRGDQIVFLIHAAKSDWSAVEPAIFGTLLERALNPRERHKLGAHYTPRSYVERLIRPALIDPLRDEWGAVKAAASLAISKAAKAEAAAEKIADDAKQHIQALDKEKAAESNKRHKDTLKQADSHRAESLSAVRDFHRKLCTLRVLDPACGSGNFLYVSLELMKRLEAEVLEAFEELGGDVGFEMASFKIGPRQFLGLELNQRAVAVAQLVLWIGFFQWQRKTTGKADTNERPLLPKVPSIVQQDAVLAYDAAVPRTDPETGETVTIWDGITTKLHLVTGNEVPDDTARKVVFDYTNPRRAEWPAADFIVGNPPFIGASPMREALGDGYVETLRRVWKGAVPDSADFVLYWWRKAAELVRDGKAVRFGFITTNSLPQTFNRRVLESFILTDKLPLHFDYAIADHPWVDSADGAAVRIAMSVVSKGQGEGTLEKVLAEKAIADGENEVSLTRSTGIISSTLSLGAATSTCGQLASNDNFSNNGVILGGKAFEVNLTIAKSLGLGSNQFSDSHLRRHVGGGSLTSRNEESFAIDLYGLSEKEIQEGSPEIYQWLYDRIRTKRLTNKRKSRREKWWMFNESVPKLRRMLEGLPRFIATTETPKHRFFSFLDGDILPDHMVISFASKDAFDLGVLSSAIHTTWCLANGGSLGSYIGNIRYNKTRCFETFPFPGLDNNQLEQSIRNLGERLDAHRKKQLDLNPSATMTGMYNALEAVRCQRPMDPKEKETYEKALVSILKQLHDELDTAVLEAYGWQDLAKGAPLADRLAKGDESAEALEQELLSRLVALNHERAEEEKRGLIRWLRPEYQAPEAPAIPAAEQQEIELAAGASATKTATIADKLTWPAGLAEQFATIQKLAPALGSDPEAIAARFGKKSAKRTAQVTEILETLQGLGKL